VSELLPVDDQATITTSTPLYPASGAPAGDIPAAEPSVADAPAAPPALAAPVPVAQPPADTELISCPECGTTAMVTLNRRDARDFCRNCDYPLFWTPSRVVTDADSGSNDQALRRLPGTVGRATVASLTCPHCAEPNAVTAENCVRCGLPLRLVAAPPPPPPPVVYVPPPPVVEPVPEQHVAWWVWALIAFGLVVTVTLIVLIFTHTIH
jgi:hypothetical protein